MRLFNPRAILTGLLSLALAIASQAVFAVSVKQQNLIDLIGQSDQIVVGTIKSVTDGFSSDGVPYTEVTLNVREQIRGKKNETYTFRQFGLMKPRKIDGRTYLGVTPEGWPHWSEKETVMLFLSGQARLTGLQTTVGLGQGKLRMQQGKLSSETRNAGLFTGVQLNATGLNQAQTEMLETDGLPVDANSFIELVRRAVNESWIEKGVMKNEL